MKLWLDDVRPAPAGWTIARTAQEAIALLDQETFDEISLDHDLGATPEDGMFAAGGSLETGLDVALHIAAGNLSRTTPIRLHTWNPAGAQRMMHTLQDAGFINVTDRSYRMGES